MAIKFQYNKTSMQDLNKQLKVRVKALPTIKNKESALRMEVKRAKNMAEELDEKLDAKINEYERMVNLWSEFNPDLIRIEDVSLSVKKIAGVRTPILENITYAVDSFSLFNQPTWFPDGIAILKDLSRIAIEREVFHRKMELLDYARRKTTQKVNLYEKVQIPGFENAILKIKRFLEDKENLSKSAQKIVKNKQAKLEEERS
ncbi:MAG: V-type ATP synthase subunit D [Bacteroidetes bacterium]|nr:MAG: V-type ATP synthase subunit D [Bacteroidota bacterium]